MLTDGLGCVGRWKKEGPGLDDIRTRHWTTNPHHPTSHHIISYQDACDFYNLHRAMDGSGHPPTPIPPKPSAVPKESKVRKLRAPLRGKPQGQSSGWRSRSFDYEMIC